MFKRENNAGLYLTIAVHLAVLIIFLLTKIGFTLREEVSFVLDFTKQEETEQLAKEAQLKEDVSKELDDKAWETIGVLMIAMGSKCL